MQRAPKCNWLLVCVSTGLPHNYSSRAHVPDHTAMCVATNWLNFTKSVHPKLPPIIVSIITTTRHPSHRVVIAVGHPDGAAKKKGQTDEDVPWMPGKRQPTTTTTTGAWCKQILTFNYNLICDAWTKRVAARAACLRSGSMEIGGGRCFPEFCSSQHEWLLLLCETDGQPDGQFCFGLIQMKWLSLDADFDRLNIDERDLRCYCQPNLFSEKKLSHFRNNNYFNITIYLNQSYMHNEWKHRLLQHHVEDKTK